MKVLERLTQKIRPDQWEALEAIDKQFDRIESGFGFPPKRRYRLMIGGRSSNTLVVEREWESLAALEKAYEGLMTSAEWVSLMNESSSVIEDGQFEILMPLP
jgi:hypothetical protein